MKPHDRVRLQHMADACDAAARFLQGRRRPDLDSDTMLRFALVQAVSIVGEAASKVSPDTRDVLPEVPWTSMVGIRNRPAHAYFDIDRESSGPPWPTRCRDWRDS